MAASGGDAIGANAYGGGRGYALVYADEDGKLAPFVHLKHALAWIALIILAYMTWGPLRATTLAVEHGDRPKAARHLFKLRMLSAGLLALGALALLAAAGGSRP